jgi:hypothetical protein
LNLKSKADIDFIGFLGWIGINIWVIALVLFLLLFFFFFWGGGIIVVDGY